MIHPNGRLPHDPQRLAAAPQLIHHLGAAAPVTLDRSALPFVPRAYAAGQGPTCVLDGLINLAFQVNVINNGTALVTADDAVPRAYGALAKCEPTLAAIEATDGLVIADVMAWQARDGFDIGQQAPLTGLAGVLPNDPTVLADAVRRLGGALLGVRLYQQDMDDFADGLDWMSPAAGPIVGLHAMTWWDMRSPKMALGSTWGRLQFFSLPWLVARLDEAWGWISMEFASAGGADIGVDFAALQAEQVKLMG